MNLLTPTVPSLPRAIVAPEVGVGRDQYLRRPAESLVFIDASIDDFETLVNGLLPGVLAFIINPEEDAVFTITRALELHGGIRNIHIVSHGSSGTLLLGSTQLTTESLDGYESQLKTWVSALSDDAQILLYGCCVAEGDRGLEFVQSLSERTGATMIASKTLTGHSSRGGIANSNYQQNISILFPVRTEKIRSFSLNIYLLREFRIAAVALLKKLIPRF